MQQCFYPQRRVTMGPTLGFLTPAGLEGVGFLGFSALVAFLGFSALAACGRVGCSRNVASCRRPSGGTDRVAS